MGLSLSLPLAKPPRVFDVPDSVLTEADKDAYAKYNEITMKIRETVNRQNMRSKQEMALFYEYRHDWSTHVRTLREEYPQWTSEDILNLRYLFEVFVEKQGYLLHYTTFNKMLDVLQDDTPPEQRKAMFDHVDTHRYNAINFEEYLQLMSSINIETPVPRPPEIEEDRDEIINLVSDLSEAHPFTQICFGLF